MPEILVATPLHHSVVSKPYTFGDGISIRKLAPILWDKATVRRYVSDDDKEFMNDDRYWLCASKEVEYVVPDAGDDLYEKAMHAAWALQIICPTGAKHVFMKFENTAEGLDNLGAHHPQQLCSSSLSRLYRAESADFQKHFETIYAGVRRAFVEGIVRLQNPILLIEHGMQTGNVPLGNLLFSMALDMLFMAGETTPFVSRIAGCLGFDSFVFPPFTLGGVLVYQPDVRVGDVIERVYACRNIIAHGGEIPEDPYRKQYTLQGVDGFALLPNGMVYIELLMDAALAMLTRALRIIFREAWVDDIAAKKPWKAKMTLFEHRYKNTLGP
jgi:hypothetical protein